VPRETPEARVRRWKLRLARSLLLEMYWAGLGRDITRSNKC
jgi:hypothetical protein